ncbi:hypothetical protein [Eubacterium ventriosum]|uniref:hypothetical protein n=1 Tax=Eubacterium ventriosum TaxID=39496 RepID=UPI00265F9837|nr:hypothetical protein [Eubacterium ventriosum]
MTGKKVEIIEWLKYQEKNKIFEIKEWHPKRSLNANAYAWALIGKIANILRTSKENVYKVMLERYGQSEVVSVLSDIDIKHFFKYYTIFGESTLNGKEYTHYRVYKGSSEYNTQEMAILIDGIIFEAKELDIETLPPGEIERLKKMWKK